MNFCIEEASDLVCDSACRKKARSESCLKLHHQKAYLTCVGKVICTECNRPIVLKDIYEPKSETAWVNGKKVTSVKMPTKHEDCDHIFCTMCRKMVTRFENDDTHKPHQCYVRPPDRAVNTPAGYIYFDYEAFPSEGGNFEVNVATMVFTHPSDITKYYYIIFTDLRDEVDGKATNQVHRCTEEDMPGQGDFPYHSIIVGESQKENKVTG